MVSVLRKVALEQRGPVPRAWYDVAEVAGMVGLSSATLYRAIKQGEFPALRIRGRYVVPARALERLEEMALESWGVVDAASVSLSELTRSEGDVA